VDYYIRYQSYTKQKPKSIILSGNVGSGEAFAKWQITEKHKSRSFSMSENLTDSADAFFQALLG
jgi:hypothetical protein